MIQQGEFSGNLKSEEIARHMIKLLEALTFNDKEKGEVTIPAGYISDKASILVLRNTAKYLAILFVILGAKFTLPAFIAIFLIVVYASLAGYGDKAAVIHDWLYDTLSEHNLSRKECDVVFYRALRASGNSQWRSYCFLVGVRMFGGLFFKRD